MDTHVCIQCGYIMSKDSAFRIRIEPDLHRAFMNACRDQGKPAAQVLREFMRRYLDEVEAERQGDLFIAESMATYNKPKG